MTDVGTIRTRAGLALAAWEEKRLSRRTLALTAAAVGGGFALNSAARVASGAGSAPTAAAQPAACPAATPAAGAAVTISNFAFDPATLTVPVGTEVTWTNQDDVPHTVTSDDKTTFASPGLDTGDQFKFRFTKPGTYAYFCSIHPMMTGKVIVK